MDAVIDMPPDHCLTYVNLGKSTLRVSSLGLGTWAIFSRSVQDGQADEIIKKAFSVGINFFDVSGDISETYFGRIMDHIIYLRRFYAIMTKVHWSIKPTNDVEARKHIVDTIKKSLQRLQSRYIDIVILHKDEPLCQMKEIVHSMNYMITNGYIKHWGTARWSQAEIIEAYTIANQFDWQPPIVDVSEYHMFCRDRCELFSTELFNQTGVGLIAWSPFSMALTGDQSDGTNFMPFKTECPNYPSTADVAERNSQNHTERLEFINGIAQRLGYTSRQLSMAWSIKHKSVQCFLLGATSTDEFDKTMDFLHSVQSLTPTIMEELESILENNPEGRAVRECKRRCCNTGWVLLHAYVIVCFLFCAGLTLKILLEGV